MQRAKIEKKKKILQSRRPEAQWVNKPSSTSGSTKIFSQFKLGPETFSVGDSVLLRNPDTDGLPFIGRLKRLYEATEGGKTDKYADVQWYYRAQDTILPKSKHDPCEVFESDVCDPNTLDAVDSKCTIHPWSKRDSDDPEIFPDLAMRDDFYCHGKYDPCKQKFMLSDNVDSKRPSQTESRAKGKGECESDAESEAYDNGEDDEDEDDAKQSKRPTKRKAKEQIQKSSKSGTPRQRKPRLTLKVPTQATQRRNAEEGMGLARNKLHVASVPDSLPCREGEFLEISAFVEDHIRDGASGCMFVSGVPGTGKTATIRAVAKHLQKELESGSLPRFQFVEINGMALTAPIQAYSDLWQAVSGREGSKVAPAQAADLLETLFKTPSPRRQCIVVLVDELDMLWTRKQEVMYNLFEWPNQAHSRLVVVAVANTMDLPERLLAHRVASRIGITRVSFSPYTHEQLATIIMNRLGSTAVFQKEAVELCSRKVAAVSGDARRALDICRRAAELAGTGLVDMRRLTEALHEMTTSPVVTAIKNATQQEKLFLQSACQTILVLWLSYRFQVVSLFLKSGIEETTFGEVIFTHIEQCRFRAHNPPSVSALASICGRLGATRILLVEPGDQDMHRRIRLNYPMEDVRFALQE